MSINVETLHVFTTCTLPIVKMLNSFKENRVLQLVKHYSLATSTSEGEITNKTDHSHTLS